jgi:hypothetical protein
MLKDLFQETSKRQEIEHVLSIGSNLDEDIVSIESAHSDLNTLMNEYQTLADESDRLELLLAVSTEAAQHEDNEIVKQVLLDGLKKSLSNTTVAASMEDSSISIAEVVSLEAESGFDKIQKTITEIVAQIRNVMKKFWNLITNSAPKLSKQIDGFLKDLKSKEENNVGEVMETTFGDYFLLDKEVAEPEAIIENYDKTISEIEQYLLNNEIGSAAEKFGISMLESFKKAGIEVTEFDRHLNEGAEQFLRLLAFKPPIVQQYTIENEVLKTRLREQRSGYLSNPLLGDKVLFCVRLRELSEINGPRAQSIVMKGILDLLLFFSVGYYDSVEDRYMEKPTGPYNQKVLSKKQIEDLLSRVKKSVSNIDSYRRDHDKRDRSVDKFRKEIHILTKEARDVNTSPRNKNVISNLTAAYMKGYMKILKEPVTSWCRYQMKLSNASLKYCVKSVEKWG